MYPWTTVTISIHAPREGGDTGHRILSTQQSRFQSTPPARGATACKAALERSGVISIHAPREGGDSALNTICAPCRIFQSTPPARGATAKTASVLSKQIISIHAPREGGDTTCRLSWWASWTISIHAPREGGDAFYIGNDLTSVISIHAPREGGDGGWSKVTNSIRQFQSTPPARGATSSPSSR